MPVLLRAALAIAALGALPAFAGQGYGDNQAALSVVDELVEEQGLDREQLLRVLASAVRQESILEAISRPAERVKPWYEYREIFLNDKRLAQGVEFFREQRDILARAERETGVPAELIVAIIGVETYYGRVTGSYRVIDALSTLAFDYPPRSDFFTAELKDYLVLTDEQGVDPLALKGSYAGAMGYGQFMPSSYRNYAVDFDGDGHTDIWNSAVDAIGSVANYFRAHGWQPGGTVVVPATVRGAVPDGWFVQGRKDLVPKHTVAEFEAAGVKPDGQLDPAALATAMKFELPGSYEYWLGLHNFYVITRYNHSAMYAMAVYQLSRQIAAEVKGG